MDFTQDSTEEDFVLGCPVKVITDEDMTAYREAERLNPPTGPNVYASPLGNEFVLGYATDKLPINNGVKDIVHVIKILEMLQCRAVWLRNQH
jgi:hypothetical protein